MLTDDVVSAVASGVLNLDTGVETTTDSLFQIGSITKIWTATLLMQLVHEGLVQLDAPIRRYLPDFRVADETVSEQVTLRHLLTHSSGIDGDHFTDVGRGDDALEKYVETCATLRQVVPLGATVSYCNAAFSVLGRVIEVVTDSVWDTALRDGLVEPLGLRHTATLPEDVLRHRAAIGHIEPPGEELRTAPAWGVPRSVGPAGAICTCATDLVEFARMHLNEGRSASGTQVVDPGSVRAMQEPQATVPSGGRGPYAGAWGLGWALHDWGGRTVLWHDGGTIGQFAFLLIVPDTRAVLVLLANGGNAIGLFRELAARLLPGVADITVPDELVPPREPLPFDPSPYVGRYDREGASFEVVARNGGMVATLTVTGLGSEMTPEPVELPFLLLDADDDLFVTQHPVLAPGIWLPVRFLTLPDGARCMHTGGGRATPRVE